MTDEKTENLFILNIRLERGNHTYFFCGWDNSKEDLIEIFRDFVIEHDLWRSAMEAPKIISAFEAKQTHYYEVNQRLNTCHVVKNTNSAEFHRYLFAEKSNKALAAIASGQYFCRLVIENKTQGLFDLSEYLHLFVSRKLCEN